MICVCNFNDLFNSNSYFKEILRAVANEKKNEKKNESALNAIGDSDAGLGILFGADANNDGDY